MLITASKNADAKMRKISKEISAHLPGFKYVPRSFRPLLKICALADAKGEGAIFILLKKEGKIVLQKYFIEEKKWRWDEKGIGILSAEFFSRADDLPIKLIAKGKEGGKIAEFFCLKTDALCARGFECSPLKIEAGKGSLKIFFNKNKCMQIKYMWEKLRGE
ncbi:hypothetical protein COU37_04290 [Candidatus Micrarchaeota archaeon CG10_big_fil_rev_8_21_14_0_10_45_29]|nr:MAG: hypothetical protein COU37_04290 [Candidatus Micrarchaeota archaeon CG10_big_fil_rev_8_21_14_0_10_45_29]